MCTCVTCVCVQAHPHMSIHVFTRVCVQGVSLTNLTHYSLFLYKELLHFCMLMDVPGLAFMANYMGKSKSINVSLMCG